MTPLRGILTPHHPFCSVSIPLTSAAGLSTLNPGTLWEAEAKMSKHCSCAMHGPIQRSCSILGCCSRGGPVSLPATLLEGDDWGRGDSLSHKEAQKQVSTDLLRSSIIWVQPQLAILRTSPELGYRRPLQASLLASEGNTPFPADGCTWRHIRNGPESATSLILGTAESPCFM